MKRFGCRARTALLLGLLFGGAGAPLDGSAQAAASAGTVAASAPERTGADPALVAALSTEGPWRVATTVEIPEVPEFGDATVYFPEDAPGPVGGVAIAPGFTEAQRHIAWWGPRLASHGYVVLVLDTNTPADRPEARADALMAAVRLLRDESGRSGSPLAGRVDGTRMAVMGHSMGGGGALIAARDHGAELSAIVPFTPWQPDPDFESITVPTLVIAGEADRVAGVAEHAWPHFESIPAATPKVYLEVAGGDHFISDTTRGTDLDTLGRYTLAWLRLYMDGDERVRPLLYGERPEGDRNKFSRYVENP